MRKIFLRIFCFALVFSFFAIGGTKSFAVNYPAPIGLVNDFAGLLPAETRSSLELLLWKYEKDTSIEITVVTVTSLEGLTVEDYTIGLAKKWGVGKKGKNNGVVLLFTPEERKVRIEVGYGLEPDLTDAQAGRIIREVIAPIYKAGRRADSVVSGVEAILKTLGNKPYDDRLKEREALAEQKRIQAQRDREQFFNILLLGGLVVIVLALLAFIAVITVRSSRKKALLRKIYRRNEEMIIEAEANLDKAEKEHKDALCKLADLQKDNPETIWGELSKRALNFSFDVRKLKKGAADLSAEEQKDFRQSAKIKPDIENLLKGSQKAASFLSDVESAAKKVEVAKSTSPKLEKEILSKFVELEKKTGHSDVAENTKKSFQLVRPKYDGAKKLLGAPLVDWLALSVLLLAISNELSGISKQVDQNVAYAEKARKEAPALLKEMPDLIEKAEKEVSKSDVSESARSTVKSVRKEFDDTKPKIPSPLTWVAVYGLLLTMQSRLSDAIRKAGSDIDDADSYHSSSYYSGGSDSGGGGGGDSGGGGFGGGDFGGGGASGDL
jgi:uncharacterized membrane protein YgcG